MKNNCPYSNKVINLAAQYWINIIKTGQDHDNGDYSFAGFLCSQLANDTAEEIDNERLESFRKAFFEEFKKTVEHYSITNEISLYCDYHPGRVLSEAAEKANIDEAQFPWKAGIVVGADHILERRPYANKTFKDSLVYCEHSYLEKLIEYANSRIEDIPYEKCLSDEDKKRFIEDYKKEIEVYTELLKTLPNYYIRKDLEATVNG